MCGRGCLTILGPTLKNQLPNLEHGEIISIAETTAFVAFAGREAPGSGDLVLHVTNLFLILINPPLIIKY